MNTLSFEQIFSRLEAILERMNAKDIPLEESLNLFEEANKLIAEGSLRLDDAEKRVETIVRNRQGEIVLSSEGIPQTVPLPMQQP